MTTTAHDRLQACVHLVKGKARIEMKSTNEKKVSKTDHDLCAIDDSLAIGSPIISSVTGEIQKCRSKKKRVDGNPFNDRRYGTKIYLYEVSRNDQENCVKYIIRDAWNWKEKQIGKTDSIYHIGQMI